MKKYFVKLNDKAVLSSNGICYTIQGLMERINELPGYPDIETAGEFAEMFGGTVITVGISVDIEG